MDDAFLSKVKMADTELCKAVEDKNSEVKILIKQRGFKRQSLTKSLNAVTQQPPLSLNNIEFYIDKLQNLKQNITKLDNDIDRLILAENQISDADYEGQVVICETYMDNLNLTLTSLKMKRAALTVTEYISVTNNNLQLPKLKLPNVELPWFDGRPVTYDKFIDNFETILNKYNMSQFEMYNYLYQQVSGAARSIVSSVPRSDNCYNVCKELLKDAFSSKIILQFSVIHRIKDLKLTSTSGFYNWISEVRVLTEQMASLENTDIFLQYFLWKGLSLEYKQQFIAANEKSKPSLKEIVDSAFAVLERMSDSKLFVNSNTDCDINFKLENATAMATDVLYKAVNPVTRVSSCSLCEAGNYWDARNHKLSNCPRYATPELKLSRNKELKGCVKCALLNHTIDKCL